MLHDNAISCFLMPRKQVFRSMVRKTIFVLLSFHLLYFIFIFWKLLLVFESDWSDTFWWCFIFEIGKLFATNFSLRLIWIKIFGEFSNCEEWLKCYVIFNKSAAITERKKSLIFIFCLAWNINVRFLP